MEEIVENQALIPFNGAGPLIVCGVSFPAENRLEEFFAYGLQLQMVCLQFFAYGLQLQMICLQFFAHGLQLQMVCLKFFAHGLQLRMAENNL
jgi:hypothetical protein